MPPAELTHVAFQTNRMSEMRDWYCAVLEGHVIYENPQLSFVPIGARFDPDELVTKFRSGVPAELVVRD